MVLMAGNWLEMTCDAVKSCSLGVRLCQPEFFFGLFGPEESCLEVFTDRCDV
jgi:hypothetical protein